MEEQTRIAMQLLVVQIKRIIRNMHNCLTLLAVSAEPRFSSFSLFFFCCVKLRSAEELIHGEDLEGRALWSMAAKTPSPSRVGRASLPACRESLAIRLCRQCCFDGREIPKGWRDLRTPRLATYLILRDCSRS